MTQISQNHRSTTFDGKVAGALNTVMLVLAAVLLFVTLTPA